MSATYQPACEGPELTIGNPGLAGYQVTARWQSNEDYYQDSLSWINGELATGAQTDDSELIWNLVDGLDIVMQKAVPWIFIMTVIYFGAQIFRWVLG